MWYILSAYIAADFVAGFIHWLEDRYWTPDMSIVGRWISAPNELHHAEPRAFLAGGFWQRNWTTIVPAAVVLLVAGALSWYWIALVAAFAAFANEIHAWAHQKGEVSKHIRVLQEMGVLQSPREHAKHHRSPYAERYCVMSDWLNPALDAYGFWRGLEYGLLRVLGWRVKDEA